tara:strand:- start:8 stop:475 length:468 start_codon:yes stop_codon:yes gene_type:complete
MFSIFKYHFYKILPFLFIILINCQLQEPYKNHGILFLKNRSEQLILNKTNKNDVINIIGQPHSTSISDENQWMYVERILTKGKYHKLGKNVLKTNNILVLNFDKYGILNNKKLFNKNNKEFLKFSKMETENELIKDSFVQSFLESVRSKMYGNRK